MAVIPVACHALSGTRTQREIEAVLQRGGVVGGNSAGSYSRFICRKRKSRQACINGKGHERGFALLKNVAVNPHLSEAMRQNELVTILDSHPNLLGIGIDEKAWIKVQDGRFEVFGKGRVAIYDNKKHGNNWYYWLSPGDQFDLRSGTAHRASKSGSAGTP